MSPSGYRHLRKGRISRPGQPYLITTICTNRAALFADWDVASATALLIAEQRLWRDSRLLCWVLMPDHLHLLVQLGDTESLGQLMQRVKAVTARGARSARERSTAPVWMTGFHDRAIRSEDNLHQAARYMVANPMRAGLAVSPGAYPFWDAIWLDGSEPTATSCGSDGSRDR